MRSRGSGRVLAEHVLRGVAVVALTVLAVRLWRAGPAPGDAVVAPNALDSALVQWTANPPASATAGAGPAPSARHRDWLLALRRNGTTIRWRSEDSSGSALVVEDAPLPGLPRRIRFRSQPGTSVMLSDLLGRVDSGTVGASGAMAWRASPVGAASAVSARAEPVASPRDSLAVRPVLVLGQAGWEGKFVIAALEEDGWRVSARLTVAPGAVVMQGPVSRIDTSSVSAVVLLDSLSPVEAPRLQRFVQDGGGLVAAGPGTRHPAVRAIVTARVSSSAPGVLGALQGPAPREGLATRTVRAGTPGAIPIERRGNDPVVVGQRIGAGRVVVAGYEDTWRLRMAPVRDDAPSDHRAWWSSMVASVALPRLLPRDIGYIDEAPFAATVDALGRPQLAGADRRAGPRLPWEALLLALALAGLLAEWASRRLRGQS